MLHGDISLSGYSKIRVKKSPCMFMYNVKKTRNFLQRFLQIYIYISTVVTVAFPPFSMTEVIWICNFVQKRELT